MVVILSISVQNFKTIGQLKRMLGTNEIFEFKMSLGQMSYIAQPSGPNYTWLQHNKILPEAHQQQW